MTIPNDRNAGAELRFHICAAQKIIDAFSGEPPVAGSEQSLQLPSWRLVTLGPRDADLYQSHLLRLDSNDRRLRFFHNVSNCVMARHAREAVSGERMLLACEAEGEIRAGAELIPSPCDPTRAEMAFSVERSWRRRGIAAALTRALIAAARAQGIVHLEMEILETNEAMITLADRFGFISELSDDGIKASLKLTDVASAKRAAG